MAMDFRFNSARGIVPDLSTAKRTDQMDTSCDSDSDDSVALLALEEFRAKMKFYEQRARERRAQEERALEERILEEIAQEERAQEQRAQEQRAQEERAQEEYAQEEDAQEEDAQEEHALEEHAHEQRAVEEIAPERRALEELLEEERAYNQIGPANIAFTVRRLSSNEELKDYLQFTGDMFQCKLQACRQVINWLSTRHRRETQPELQQEFGDDELIPADIIEMLESITIPTWTITEVTDYFLEILDISRNLRVKELTDQMAQLSKEQKYKKKTVRYQKQIRSLKKEINKVKNKDLNDVALPIDQDYDWDAIAKKFHEKHSARVYKNFWKLILHPSINKSSWTPEENVSLERIAHEHHSANWKGIAAELNTGRSSYQCFLHHRQVVRKS